MKLKQNILTKKTCYQNLNPKNLESFFTSYVLQTKKNNTNHNSFIKYKENEMTSFNKPKIFDNHSRMPSGTLLNYISNKNDLTHKARNQIKNQTQNSSKNSIKGARKKNSLHFNNQHLLLTSVDKSSFINKKEKIMPYFCIQSEIKTEQLYKKFNSNNNSHSKKKDNPKISHFSKKFIRDKMAPHYNIDISRGSGNKIKGCGLSVSKILSNSKLNNIKNKRKDSSLKKVYREMSSMKSNKKGWNSYRTNSRLTSFKSAMVKQNKSQFKDSFLKKYMKNFFSQNISDDIISNTNSLKNLKSNNNMEKKNFSPKNKISSQINLNKLSSHLSFNHFKKSSKYLSNNTHKREAKKSGKHSKSFSSKYVSGDSLPHIINESLSLIKEENTKNVTKNKLVKKNLMNLNMIVDKFNNTKQKNKNLMSNNSNNTNSNNQITTMFNNYNININNHVTYNNINNYKNNNNASLTNYIKNKSQAKFGKIPTSTNPKKKNFTATNSPNKLINGNSQKNSCKNSGKQIIKKAKYIQSAQNLINVNKKNKINKKTKNQKSKEKEKIYEISDIKLDINKEKLLINDKKCEFYMNQSKKMIEFIKNYYKTNKKYPQTDTNFYMYGRKIGEGAFAKVNLGLNLLTGRIVAIKSFEKKLLDKNEKVKKIIYETNLMKKLNHKNITKILEMFENEKYFFIVMEYINGGNLLSYIRKRRKISERKSKFIFRQIIEGIKYIHSQNIVHRDIKLENILIDYNNNIKICDFGIGKIYSNKNELLYDHCGTPMYMAPEIILSNEKIGYKGFPVDIWSSGIVLYIMLSGNLPFNINGVNNNNNNNNLIDTTQLEYEIINERPNYIHRISHEAKDLLNGLLNKNPDKRLTIEQILEHPWLNEREDFLIDEGKYKLFTKAEMILISKTYVDYRKAKNEDLKENFTTIDKFLISNENNISQKKDDELENDNNKSILLTPYNTLKYEIKNENITNNSDSDCYFYNPDYDCFEDINNKNLLKENNLLVFSEKVKECNKNYELNNNKEVDNGMIINSHQNSVNNSLKDSNYSQSISLIIYDEEKQESEKIEEIYQEMESMGYNREYIKNCLDKNILCHASSVYYLLMNYKDIQ